jgi:hypothetical protein
MLATVEMRWFYEGEIPASMWAWFRSDMQHTDVQPAREDCYLSLPDCDSLGIKLRQGRIELKQHCQEYGAVRVHERIAGVPQLWRKWSFLLADSHLMPAGVPGQPPGWIPVRKERALRTYRVAGEGTVTALPPGEFPPRGCHLELTELRVQARMWWTFGLEASGEETTLHSDLLLVARKTLAVGDPPSFAPGDCSSYPRWLQAVASDMGR